MKPRAEDRLDAPVVDGTLGGPPDSPERETRQYQLGVYERVGFFVNPTAGSPVGGAKEITEAAAAAGLTCTAFNVGDRPGNDWAAWRPVPVSVRRTFWGRCDTGPRCGRVYHDDIANIESPEINAGFCTPEHAVQLVGEGGGIITEGIAPHADWSAVNEKPMPVWLEIDPTVPVIAEKLRTIGIQGLVDYARDGVGIALPIPCFFIVPNPWWDGEQGSFPTYWDFLREQWPAPLPFALYPAENVPDWTVVK